MVAGGGFAGAEVIAELFDLVHGVLHYFPGIGADEPRFVLVHSRDRILPELSAALAGYALDRLRARGIEFRLGVRVTEATAEDVLLGDGQRIPTGTFIWTAGIRPSPLVANLGGARARNGALVTDASFRVVGLERVWALGDCAQIPDVDRAGEVADNIAAGIHGGTPNEFRFAALGVLVALGHRTAAAAIRGTGSPGWPRGCCGAGSTWRSCPAARSGSGCFSTGRLT